MPAVSFTARRGGRPAAHARAARSVYSTQAAAGAHAGWSNSEEKEVIMDTPALGLKSLIWRVILIHLARLDPHRPNGQRDRTLEILCNKRDTEESRLLGSACRYAAWHRPHATPNRPAGQLPPVMSRPGAYKRHNSPWPPISSPSPGHFDTDIRKADTPDTITEGEGDRAPDNENAPMPDDYGNVCPSGWDETYEVQGRDDLCDVDLAEDVGEYILGLTPGHNSCIW